MVDCFTADVRSRVMAAVRSKGNKTTELNLIKIFKTNNITGWRRHQNIVGHPDFVFLKHNIAVFSDGCFWHGHDCRNTKPKANKSFWDNKITKNMQRDIRNNLTLLKSNWIVIRFWECEINSESYKGKLRKLLKAMNQDSPSPSLARRKEAPRKPLKSRTGKTRHKVSNTKRAAHLTTAKVKP